MRDNRVGALLLGTVVLVAATAAGHAVSVASGSPRAAGYPYGSAAFARFLRDSEDAVAPARGQPFSVWFERAYTTSPARLPGQTTLRAALASRARAVRAGGDAGGRAQEELRTAVWAYRLLKTTIPRFSLSRGFEFAWTVRYGERQCLLQSVLLAGLLQAAGADAGVAMVWKNMAGQESNNGHAVTIVRLADGRDVEIDASEPRPTATHQGLFVAEARTGRYRFVEPVFDRSGMIVAYRPAAGGHPPLRPREIRLLGVAFLRGQFHYYRGEQVAGGLVNGPTTAAGLRAAARRLEMAVQVDPHNPLAVYMLGRVYLRSGQRERARSRLLEAYRLYAQAGHIPEGPRAALAAAGAR